MNFAGDSVRRYSRVSMTFHVLFLPTPLRVRQAPKHTMVWRKSDIRKRAITSTPRYLSTHDFNNEVPNMEYAPCHSVVRPTKHTSTRRATHDVLTIISTEIPTINLSYHPIHPPSHPPTLLRIAVRLEQDNLLCLHVPSSEEVDKSVRLVADEGHDH